MRLLDLTLPTPEENLALDEALLEEAETADGSLETLRIWESNQPMIVIGRSSRVAEEVRLDTCRQQEIPVLRRTSGGAAIVAGPGCLMYAVVLGYRLRPTLRSIDQTHRFVLGTLLNALRPLVPNVDFQGTSDLALDDRKFSGNSLRCRRDHLLYHGTLLYDFPIDGLETYLSRPPREPNYRRNRPHAAFVDNLPLDGQTLRQTLISAFDATEPCTNWPREATARLVRTRYSLSTWNFER